MTNAPTMSRLEGPSSQYGGSGSLGLSIGGELTIFEDSVSGKIYTGGTASIGVGISSIVADAHADLTNSWVWYVNVYDATSAIFDLLYIKK